MPARPTQSSSRYDLLSAGKRPKPRWVTRASLNALQQSSKRTRVTIGWTTSRERNFLDNIHVTVWHADERKAALVPGGWGTNFSFTHYVGDKWLPFLRAGYAKDGGSLLEKTVSAGIGYQHVPGGSLLGVGVNWGRPNKSTFQPGLRDQQATEVFYRIQLSQEFALTPSLQWLNNPALAPERDSTWVFGLRARLAL